MKRRAQEGTHAMGHKSNLVHVFLYSNEMIAEREKKRCELDGPPAGHELGLIVVQSMLWVGLARIQ